MPSKQSDLRSVLHDICKHFHLLDGDSQEKLHLLEVQMDSIVVEAPPNLPQKKSIKGYIQKLSLELFYSIEGKIIENLPGQKPNTMRIKVDPDGVKTFDRRIYPRYVLDKPIEAVITSEDETEALLGLIINISPAGLRVEVNERIYLQNRYRFNFEIEQDDATYTLSLMGKPVSETMLNESFVYGIWLGEGEDDRKVVTEEEEDDGTEEVSLMGLVNKLIERQKN